MNYIKNIIEITEYPWIYNVHISPKKNTVYDVASHNGKPIFYYCSSLNAKDDCRLISASPELLHVAILNTLILEKLDHTSILEGSPTFDNIKAIKKATGKTWDEIKDVI